MKNGVKRTDKREHRKLRALAFHRAVFSRWDQKTWNVLSFRKGESRKGKEA